MTIKTIIFDLDGTLLNTLLDLHKGFNYAIEAFGYPKRSVEEINNFVGNGIVQAIKLAIGKEVSSDKLDRIIEVFKSYYKEHSTDLTTPYDGIIDLLNELKDRGYKIGVVSNKYDYAVKTLCSKYFKGLVDIAVGESIDVRKKPEIDGVLKVCKELNCEIKNCIFVGDSDVDILTAKNINIPCISVLWGYRNKEFLEKNGGRIFAKAPKDIIKIIEKKIYLS